MSDIDRAPVAPEPQPGVLSSLPKTRPQRPSARRAAAKEAATATAATKPHRPRKRKTATAKTPPKAPRQSRRKAPRQGFEADGDGEIPTGKPVSPPSGLELAGSVVELLGELAQSGIRSGERALRDALARIGGT
jgi:hypothetical protein